MYQIISTCLQHLPEVQSTVRFYSSLSNTQISSPHAMNHPFFTFTTFTVIIGSNSWLAPVFNCSWLSATGTDVLNVLIDKRYLFLLITFTLLMYASKFWSHYSPNVTGYSQWCLHCWLYALNWTIANLRHRKEIVCSRILFFMTKHNHQRILWNLSIQIFMSMF